MWRLKTLLIGILALLLLTSSVEVCLGASPVKSRGDHGASLLGSKESRLKQNEQADKEGLNRIKNDAELGELIASGKLVPLPENEFIEIDEKEVALKLRWCRPWVRQWLLDESPKFYRIFGEKMRITSAVRTIQHQRELRRKNRNADAAEGLYASAHLTGSAIDIGKKGMGREELSWLRRELLFLEAAGLIEATEESVSQSNFHVMVFKHYKSPT